MKTAHFMTVRLTLLSLIVLLSLSGCFNISTQPPDANQTIVGSGKAQTERRTLPAFTGIITLLPVPTKVVCQEQQDVAITIDDNILPYIQTEVVDGKLRITTSPNVKISINSSASQVIIKVPRTSSIESLGVGNIAVTNITGSTFEVHSSGSGNITLTGTTQHLTVNSTGNGVVTAKDLLAEQAKVNVMGIGNVQVYVSQRLEAIITGLGNITYFGNPSIVQRTIIGLGTVSKGE